MTNIAKSKAQLIEELEKLQLQGKVWQDIFDAIFDIAVVLSSDHKFIKVNKAGCKTLGMREEEMLVKKCFEIVHGLETPIEGCPCVKTLKSGNSEVGEFSEKGRSYIAAASPIFDKNDELILFTHTVKDITERKQVETGIHERELLLNESQRIGNMGSWEWDMVTQEHKWSENYYLILGLQPFEIKPSFEIFRNKIHPEDVQILDKNHALLFKNKKPFSHEVRITLPDGTLKWIQNNVVPVIEDDKISKLKGVIIDITERKKAEDILRMSEEKYRSLVESTDDLIYLVDKKCSYIFMNKKHAARFNIPLEKIIGRPYSEFHSKKESEAFREEVHKVIKTGNPTKHEQKSERDGRFYLRTYSPVKNEKEETIAVNVISKDITELKQVEIALKKSEQEIYKFAEYQQSVREEERAVVAGELHDEIGQALSSLQMDIFMIKNSMSKTQKEIPPRFQNMEKLLVDSVQKLRKIYSELRPTLLEHFGIGEAMRQYAADFQEEAGIQCLYFQDPEEIVLDDKRSIALYRILQGALNNIKWHSLATKVKVRLEEKGPNLILTIQDNGKGIKEEHIKNEKSFGLIGMRERSKFLGGKFEIKGLPNKGTTVKVEIPLKLNNTQGK